MLEDFQAVVGEVLLSWMDRPPPAPHSLHLIWSSGPLGAAASIYWAGTKHAKSLPHPVQPCGTRTCSAPKANRAPVKKHS